MAVPVLIGCRDVVKAYGDRPLFDGLSFAIHEGDRVGVVGPNGTGKSTLLRILAGEESPDAGDCFRKRGLRVGYVPQRPQPAEDGSARDAVVAALVAADHDDPRPAEARAAIALGAMGFDDPEAPVATMSGGWRTRLAIATALAHEPDLLLLDEPTNHLDLPSIVALERSLAAAARAFVVVSHDRAFLQAVAGRMIELDPVHAGGLLSVDGPYDSLLETRADVLEAQDAHERALAGRVRRELAWLRRGAKARTSKSRSRIDAAERSIGELREATARRLEAERSVGVALAGSGRRTKRLWHCEGLGKRFDERRIVDGLELTLGPGDRLGVLGANGSGKTTLLEMIVGRLEPDRGRIVRAKELRTVYFDQTRESVDPSLTLAQALAPEGEQVVHRGRPLHVVAWAERFRFRREQLPTRVERLSGGERARIVLARMMLEPADLLVLDEPTNDLDIDTLDVLEESLLEFPGALVLVTHDRTLMDRVSTSILALDGRGGVERYAETSQWLAATERAARTAKTAERKGREPSSSAAKSVAPARKKKLSYIAQREWDEIEERIEAADARLDEARRAAEDPAVASDAAALEARLADLQAAQAEVDALYARWAELEAMRDGDES